MNVVAPDDKRARSIERYKIAGKSFAAMTENTEIESFVEVARRYCAWVEGSPKEPQQDILLARILLAQLHVTVLALPENIPDTEMSEDSLTSPDWTSVQGRFQHLPINGYWDVFDPLKDEEPVFNTLWDDLTDIWKDLKEGLLLYDRGELEEAVWQWSFNFKIHWGQHLTGAQRAIHAYVIENELPSR